jgi:uncharacterized membrane protein YraQ (UPF0718 family)
MKKILQKYKLFLFLLFINIVWVLVSPALGLKSLQISADNLIAMFVIVPPIFILIGLLHVWVPRETIVKLMGEKSGLLGVSLALVLGSFSAGPLYAAFPVAGALLNKGSKFSNVLLFIGAWSTTKIPMLLFEGSAMGWQFMLTRMLINILGIFLIAYLVEKAIPNQEKALIYEKSLS